MLVLRNKGTMFPAMFTLFAALVVHKSEAASEFYVETICDGEPRRIVKCPQQDVISTVWASYGRNHPDTCVEGDQLINTTCNVDYDNVLSMVQESCDDSNNCTLESSKAEYGDPPECQGVRKYLQMYYLCKSELIRKTVCEFEAPKNITCPESQTIVVVDANYGRTDKWTCGEELADNDRCISAKSEQIIKDKCEGNNFCELDASNEVFGNPCGQIHKYIEVNFHCQAGKIVGKAIGNGAVKSSLTYIVPF